MQNASDINIEIKKKKKNKSESNSKTKEKTEGKKERGQQKSHEIKRASDTKAVTEKVWEKMMKYETKERKIQKQKD